jgi:hypothetical protein
VHLDDRAVEGNGFDFDLNNLLSLHGLEDLIQNAALGPAHHAGADRVPGSKMLGEPPPFAALFGDIQNGIEDLKVGESHIAALNREAMGDLLVLGFADFHPRNLPEYVLTGPSISRRTSPACAVLPVIFADLEPTTMRFRPSGLSFTSGRPQDQDGMAHP